MISYIIVYTIAVYGLSAAMVYFNGPFNIINNIREWLSNKHSTLAELFSCMFCLPTNIGLILSIIAWIANVNFTPFTLFFHNIDGLRWLVVMMDAFYCGASVYLINTIQEKIEFKQEREVL